MTSARRPAWRTSRSVDGRRTPARSRWSWGGRARLRRGGGEMTGLVVGKGSGRVRIDDGKLAAIAGRARDRLKRTAGDILAIGADLIRAKELLGHGNFGAWLDAEFGLSRRTA